MVGDESKGGPRWAQLTGDIVSPVIETEQIEGLKEVTFVLDDGDREALRGSTFHRKSISCVTVR